MFSFWEYHNYGQIKTQNRAQPFSRTKLVKGTNEANSAHSSLASRGKKKKQERSVTINKRWRRCQVCKRKRKLAHFRVSLTKGREADATEEEHSWEITKLEEKARIFTPLEHMFIANSDCVTEHSKIFPSEHHANKRKKIHAFFSLWVKEVRRPRAPYFFPLGVRPVVGRFNCPHIKKYSSPRLGWNIWQSAFWNHHHRRRRFLAPPPISGESLGPRRGGGEIRHTSLLLSTGE